MFAPNKTIRNPLVPLGNKIAFYTLFQVQNDSLVFEFLNMVSGALATAGVLVGGLVAFKKGNYRVSQQMMRARVVFQAATVALMVGTFYASGVKK